jgi:hypothetical protein
VSPFPINASLTEHEIQLPSAEEPLADASSPTDESCESPMEELKIYFRRQKSKTTSSKPCQALNLDQGNPISTPSLNFLLPSINDIDHPIAQRKGDRSCTQHPISNFVSYQHLSTSFRSLVSKLFSESIPQNL